MTAWTGVATLLLLAVSAAGVATPFLRRSRVEAPMGSVEEPAPESIRSERVRDVRVTPHAPARTRWLVPSLGVLAAVTVTAAIALGADRTDRSDAVATGRDPLAFLESLVRDDPRDVAARLDLAHRYIDLDRADEAVAQYLAVLSLEPADPEAHAHLGLLQYVGGHPVRGLRMVERALQASPSYPEALFIKGVILLEGLDRPEQAASAFRAYLDAAPFGSERHTANRLIREAESGEAP
jgi:Flp pilus assembly protein TadD